MVRCCFCQSVQSKGCGRTYHKFPLSNKFLLEQWINNVPLKHWKPSNGSLLCSDHFTEDCFDRSEFRVRLKLNSIPTCFGDPPTACIMCKRKRLHQSPYSFFRFPLGKPELLNKWLGNMIMLNWRPTETSYLCSSHFEASCLRKVKGKYWALKENSIPTIFTSSDYSSLNDTPEFLASKKNTPPPPESNIITNSVPHHKSYKVLSVNPVPVDEARRKSSHDVIDIPMKTLHNSDNAGTGLTSMQFDFTTASPVCKSRRIVDHDHRYESSTMHDRLFHYEQMLKEKDEIIKLQKRKLDRLQRKVSFFREMLNELRSSVKVQVSEACLRSLESIVDPGVKQFLQCVIDNGDCHLSTSKDQ
ncbi:THAP domain-containing protein 1 [Formica fusca]